MFLQTGITIGLGYNNELSDNKGLDLSIVECILYNVIHEKEAAIESLDFHKENIQNSFIISNRVFGEENKTFSSRNIGYVLYTTLQYKLLKGNIPRGFVDDIRCVMFVPNDFREKILIGSPISLGVHKTRADESEEYLKKTGYSSLGLHLNNQAQTILDNEAFCVKFEPTISMVEIPTINELFIRKFLLISGADRQEYFYSATVSTGYTFSPSYSFQGSVARSQRFGSDFKNVSITETTALKHQTMKTINSNPVQYVTVFEDNSECIEELIESSNLEMPISKKLNKRVTQYIKEKLESEYE